jgi:enoyl-CoA hydratase/carnithine racemase
VAIMSLNRPHVRNAYTVRMSNELVSALDIADQDHNIRVIILTGKGTDFCVGAEFPSGGLDTDELGAATEEDWREPAGRCSMRIFMMNKPVIAAVRGAAVGAGVTIILSCDFRLAATNSKFGFVFSRRGLYPEGASAWFLPRLVGLGTALDWMVSGRIFDAEEAQRAGLLSRLCPENAVLDDARALAASIAESTAPVSVAVIRQLIYRASSMASPFEIHDIDSKLVASLITSPDAIEGITSFLQRRPPRFRGHVPRDMPSFLSEYATHVTPTAKGLASALSKSASCSALPQEAPPR